jgi:metallo-beta-lactamase class B
MLRIRLTTKLVLALLLVVAVIFCVRFFRQWREGTINGGQTPAEPFRIAGNFYYVGASDVASFLITGPQGHILIDGGYPGTPRLVMDSIEKLGFSIKDVKILLNSEPHYDHAGGLAELQRASGAELWVSEPNADIVASGGSADPRIIAPARAFVYLLSRYTAPRVDHRFKDGAKITLGTTEITARITAGHTAGCTSFTLPVNDGARTINVVHACSLTPIPTFMLKAGAIPAVISDFERTFATLRSLPEDIWVTVHAREFGRYRKFVVSKSAPTPVDAFIDREGYQQYIDEGERKFRKEYGGQLQHR